MGTRTPVRPRAFLGNGAGRPSASAGAPRASAAPAPAVARKSRRETSGMSFGSLMGVDGGQGPRAKTSAHHTTGTRARPQGNAARRGPYGARYALRSLRARPGGHVMIVVLMGVSGCGKS